MSKHTLQSQFLPVLGDLVMCRGGMLGTVYKIHANEQGAQHWQVMWVDGKYINAKYDVQRICEFRDAYLKVK